MKRLPIRPGDRYGRLTVLWDNMPGKGVTWFCVCDCEKTANVEAHNLKSGIVRSCGCLQREYHENRRIRFERGQRFGRLTIIGETGTKSPAGGILWSCQCDCGKTVDVPASQLKRGLTKSCGCLQHESRIIHGMHRSPEYTAWAAMVQRCHNPRSSHFVYYGGRGIKVCDRWRRSFKNFFADVGTKPSSEHSLERTNNNVGYEPGNVRWATRLEQARNKSTNRLLTIGGVTKPLSWWADHSGKTRTTIQCRLLSGRTAAEAVLSPSAKELKAWEVEKRALLSAI